MPFLQSLLELDLKLLHLINSKWTAIWLDNVMITLSSQKFWIPIIAVLIIWGALRAKSRYKITWIVLIVLMPCLEAISSHGFKNIIDRPRPCKELPVRLLWSCSKHSSMPSSHAVTSMGTVAWIALRHPATSWFLIPLAIAIGYSRVYLGVHYPTDVMAGFILGWMISLIVYFSTRKALRHWQQKLENKSNTQSP